jgi:YjbR
VLLFEGYFMTADRFRALVLSFPETEERAHHDHPDFRVGGKIFATLGYPDATHGMVQLTPEQQAEFMHDFPLVFSPAAGAWGLKGSTIVHLAKATKAVLEVAVGAAYKNTIAKSSVRRSPVAARGRKTS